MWRAWPATPPVESYVASTESEGPPLPTIQEIMSVSDELCGPILYDPMIESGHQLDEESRAGPAVVRRRDHPSQCHHR
jgi:hypothetical protein